MTEINKYINQCIEHYEALDKLGNLQQHERNYLDVYKSIRDKINELPPIPAGISDEDIKEKFELSESQCQDPYSVAKEAGQIEGAKWMRSIANQRIGEYMDMLQEMYDEFHHCVGYADVEESKTPDIINRCKQLLNK